ncbi:MAG: 3-oxoacyl-ACP reductase [Porticoccaceae bacterium]|nr:3-oxoacyl-ACP reductase [Porticoccaceae bacterium]
MSDKYLEFANSKLGRSIVSVLGLPKPPRLIREDSNNPHYLSGNLLCGTTTGALYGTQINQSLGATEVNFVSEEAESCHLVFDASGIRSTDQTTELYQFFHNNLAKLPRCGRVVIIGQQPSNIDNVEHAIAQRGLVGFMKSVAKEIGRKGATANLIYLNGFGHKGLAAPLRFLLSAGCAYTNGQVITLTTPVTDIIPEHHWQQPLNGKSVVVTGAARGIGLAMSQVLARDGAMVIGVDVPQSKEQLEKAMSELDGIALALDITAEDAPQRLIDCCAQQEEKLQAVVHNAGITRDKMLSRMTEQQWQLLVDINIGSIQRINHALLATQMLDQGGRIVGVASISGIAGNLGQSNYAYSKSAVIGMVDSMAPICAKRGITINAVAPGFIETKMTAAIPFATRQFGRRLCSLSQGGLPEDVAEVVAFYLSPQASGVNGNTIRVCGQNLMGA